MAGSVYCDGTRWVGEPEKGFWCYTKPAHPEPSCVLVEKCVTKIEEVHEQVRKQFILSFFHLSIIGSVDIDMKLKTSAKALQIYVQDILVRV